MENSKSKLQQLFEEWVKEDDKFAAGNAAAGTRARKALAEMTKMIKSRRNEITEEKNARKEAKAK